MKRSKLQLESAHGCKDIKDKLSPDWLRDCVMIDDKNKSIVISPIEALKHGYPNLFVTQNRFCGKTIFKLKLDFDIVRINHSKAEEKLSFNSEKMKNESH
jgi:hypothetical protein